MRLGLAVALFASLSVFVAARLRVTSGITHFISTGSERELSLISRSMAESALARTIILSIAAPDLATAIRASREWKQILQSNPQVASLRVGPTEDVSQAVFDLYFPRRFGFLSPRPERELPVRFSDRGLQDAARRLRRELSSPAGDLVKQVAPADPLLAFPNVLRRFEEARLGDLRVVQGHFVDAEASQAISFLTTRDSAFDVDHQAPFAEFLKRSFEELDHRFGGELRLERSGIHRFAAASERSARRDVARIAGVSTAGLLMLFLLMFRSPWLVLIAFVPLAGGILVAMAVGILAFGSLHILTIAFGATLIGVCIDYPIHYANHHSLRPSPFGARGSFLRVWPALRMGALTTVAGFAGLAASDFPGVREIGVAAGVGVLAALLLTRALLPFLVPDPLYCSTLQTRTADALWRLVAWLRRHRVAWSAVPLAALLLCAIGLPKISWQDDVYALNLPLDATWLAEDARVRARVSQVDAGRVVLALGSDTDELLQLNDLVHEQLSEARKGGLLEDFRSLHAFLWSEKLQQRNLAQLGRSPDLGRRTVAALEAEGFRRDAFEPFLEAIRRPLPAPLRRDELLDSPLADLVAPFRIELEQGAALVTFLRGVHDPEGLEASLSGLAGVYYFDQQRFLQGVYRRYREKAVGLVAVGLLAIVALLQFHYRRPTRALAAAVPAILAAASTLALFALAGIPINLLHMLGTLLVLSFGVDYTIFLLESREEEAAVALLGIGIACASTCLSFGLLALSSFPALRALGVTTGTGVVLSLLLAPTVLVVAGESRGPASPETPLEPGRAT